MCCVTPSWPPMPPSRTPPAPRRCQPSKSPPRTLLENTMNESSDLLNIDSLFSLEELAMRDKVRSFVDSTIRPNIAAWYEQAIFPVEIIKDMAGLGLLGMHLQGYGCPGRSAVEYGIAAMELEAGDSGLRTFVSVQGSLAMSAIYKHGSEEQK